MENRRGLTFLILALAGASLLLGAAIVFRGMGEAGDKNTFAMLADAFLHGRFAIDKCFDSDCLPFAGKLYVAMPPFPAIVAMPFVAIAGTGFAGFILLALALFVSSGIFWWKIFQNIDAHAQKTILLLLALLFCTPLFYVTLRGDGIWFFAQATAFFLVSGALHAVLVLRKAWLAGIFIGLAFLSRQMLIFYAPLLLILMIRSDQKLLIINRQRLGYFLQIAVPVAVCILAYFYYNYARFGHPLESGYRFIFTGLAENDENRFLLKRLRELGLFDASYVLFNIFYLFFEGFHVEFGGVYKTVIVGIDTMGSSVFAVSPFLFFMFLVSPNRSVVVGWLIILILVGVTLFYHSNGFSQHNVQRYTLDWLPIAFLFMAKSLQPANLPIFAILAGYSVVLNVVALLVVRAVS